MSEEKRVSSISQAKEQVREFAKEKVDCKRERVD